MLSSFKRMTLEFVVQNSVIVIVFILFVILSVLGLLPTLILTWKASGGWPDPWEILKNIWELNEETKWEQLLAFSTAALTMATSLVGIVGFLALFGALHHVRKVETASRAELLLNLERQVTNLEMMKAQQYLYELFADAIRKTQKHSPDLDHMEMVKHISFECHKQLAHLRIYDEKKYHALFKNCEFFETVGIMVRKKYVDLDDIISRFEVGIERVHACFDCRLEKRRKESWVSHLFFQHISELFEQVKRFREQRVREQRKV